MTTLKFEEIKCILTFFITTTTIRLGIKHIVFITLYNLFYIECVWMRFTDCLFIEKIGLPPMSSVLEGAMDSVTC